MEGVEDIPGVALKAGVRFAWDSFAEYLNNSYADALTAVAVDRSGVLAGKVVASLATTGHALALTADGAVAAGGAGTGVRSAVRTRRVCASPGPASALDQLCTRTRPHAPTPHAQPPRRPAPR